MRPVQYNQHSVSNVDTAGLMLNDHSDENIPMHFKVFMG